MSKIARYIIVLDRMDDDDNVNVKDEGYYGPARTDKEGMIQVAAELQEAMTEMGEPAGFFRVVARSEVDYDTVIHTVTPDEDAHRAAMRVLEDTRAY